ncbi:uncharacterized protein METZ01_LOCUS54978 [marine metagenome]|jgi:hypothetical protein|uniref:Uncharacterized protein n=1 Tax=marine metagenome TaxID=408172 RepID=A0A381SF70_9ZZZZ|tara:strand:+ start:87 stop:245 length:159 start_codon:yes stop_codon:yes gene_type:complete
MEWYYYVGAAALGWFISAMISRRAAIIHAVRNWAGFRESFKKIRIWAESDEE